MYKAMGPMKLTKQRMWTAQSRALEETPTFKGQDRERKPAQAHEQEGPRKLEDALAGKFSWLERHSIHQNVVGSTPAQDKYLGCRFDPWLGCIWEATN